jgi:hypothetical protein
VAHNLDFNKVKGNSNMIESLFIHLSNDFVTKNLQSIGILLGNCSNQINLSVKQIKEVEAKRAEEAKNKDMISEVFDEEEKEEEENEEVDKLILNSLCSEIMDEVMDLGTAYPKDCKSTPRQHTSSLSKKAKKIRSKAKNKGAN